MFNLGNRLPTVIDLDGDGSDTLSCDMPSYLSNSLLSKHLGVESMQMGNSNIPVFIPNLRTAATTNFVSGATTTVQLNNTVDANSLDYFIVLRKNDNSTAVVSYVIWKPTNPVALTPPSYIPTGDSVIETPYYFCFDFTDFMNRVFDACVLAIQQQLLNATAFSFILDADTQTFNLTVPENIINSYTLELSASLQALFQFQASITNYGTYIPTYPNLTLTVDSIVCYNASTSIKDTVFPFDLVLFSCNLPMVEVEFCTNKVGKFPLKDRIMFMFKKVNAGINIGSSFYAYNDNLIDKLHSFTADQAQGNKLRLTLILRTRVNRNYLRWPIPVGSTISLSLNTYEVV